MGFLFLSSCQRPSRAEDTPTNAPGVETPTSPPSPILPEPTNTPTPTYTPTPHSGLILPPIPGDEIPALVSVEMLNLRSGPSTLFNIVDTYPEGTEITVRGKALGDEWVRVSTQNEETGWMLAIFLDLPVPIENIPIETDIQALIVYGKVVETTGYPIDGINLAISNPSVEEDIRTDAHSNNLGDFYAYLPPESNGVWQVSIVGINCESIVMDEDCRLRSFFERQVIQFIQLPITEPVIFVYERATTLIRGTVIDDLEQSVAGIRVFAVRADGARSWSSTDEFGEFELPASNGHWDVYAVQFDPRVEGERVQIDIVSGSTPGALFIQAPSTDAEG